MSPQQNFTHTQPDTYPAPRWAVAPILTVTIADVTGQPVDTHVRDDPISRPVTVPGRRRKQEPVLHRVTSGMPATRDSTDAAVVVRAIGEVDICTAPILAAALHTGCIAACRSRPLVIDLTGLRFFSAAGLTLLVTTRRQCHERRVPLRVVATHRSVLRPLHITGLDVLFDVTSSLVEAIRPGMSSS
jgi:anti-sigma B factor antagonist